MSLCLELAKTNLENDKFSLQFWTGETRDIINKSAFPDNTESRKGLRKFNTFRKKLFYTQAPYSFLGGQKIGKDIKEALKGAIMDYLIICQSDVLIHNLGSLSNAALLTNPSIKNVLIGSNKI